MRTILWVGLGSGLGGGARFAVAEAAARLVGPGFPSAILTINLLGSLLIGLLAALAIHRRVWQEIFMNEPFLMAGFCGGFTTFSLFSLQTMQLFEGGRPAAAVLYSLATVVGSVAAAWSGHWLGRSAAPPPGS